MTVAKHVAGRIINKLIMWDRRVHPARPDLNDNNSNKKKTASRAEVMQLSVSPYKQLLLDGNVSIAPQYGAAFECAHNTQTYLVYEHRVITPDGTVVFCPFTLRFIKISNTFCSLFGFEVGELRNFRMLCGPKTNCIECFAIIRDAFETRTKKRISIVLYTKAGEVAGTMGLALSYHAGTPALEVITQIETPTKFLDAGVSVACYKIGN